MDRRSEGREIEAEDERHLECNDEIMIMILLQLYTVCDLIAAVVFGGYCTQDACLFDLAFGWIS